MPVVEFIIRREASNDHAVEWYRWRPGDGIRGATLTPHRNEARHFPSKEAAERVVNRLIICSPSMHFTVLCTGDPVGYTGPEGI